jgi:hypothetical protein
MASNKYTLQPPAFSGGASTQAVMAERVYMANQNTAFADPVAKLNGADPAGFTDMGVVMGSKVQFTYTKDIKYVETGIEKVRRGAYTMGKTAQAVFSLEQYDLDTLSLLTGQSITTVGSIGGKMQIGQDDIVNKALVFMGTNKVDGKEHIMYCKQANIAWNIEDNGDARVIKVTADLYPFVATGETQEGYATFYVLD